MKKTAGFRKAASLLKAADNIVIFTHMRPDFDTIGSAKALEYALKKLGKRVCVCCPDELTQRFLIICDSTHTQIEFAPDFVVCVDMATEVMLGKYLDEYAGRADLSIDHHLSNSPFAKYTLCDSTAAATGELIYELCRYLGVNQDKTIAKYLYCAISSDSGCFRYSNTTSRTHAIAAELLKFDIGAAYLNRKMLEVKTKEQIALEKLCYETLRFYANGKIAVMTVTLDMCKKSGADISDVDALVQLPRTIQGVEAGITLKQQEQGKYKVSIRSNDYFDATKLAMRYGGGGHIRASGFVVYGDNPSALADEIAKAAMEQI